jgi:hypothetical protein
MRILQFLLAFAICFGLYFAIGTIAHKGDIVARADITFASMIVATLAGSLAAWRKGVVASVLITVACGSLLASLQALDLQKTLPWVALAGTIAGLSLSKIKDLRLITVFTVLGLSSLITFR